MRIVADVISFMQIWQVLFSKAVAYSMKKGVWIMLAFGYSNDIRDNIIHDLIKWCLLYSVS
jgi:hypothetical protein